MLKFSKKIEYALIALLHMTKEGPEQVTSARELSDLYQIPPELLGKTLQRLAREGLVASVQGVRGGYRINTDISKLTVEKIVTALEGPINIVSCFANEHEPASCNQHVNCSIKHTMGIIQGRLASFLSTISLEDIRDEISMHSKPVELQ